MDNSFYFILFIILIMIIIEYNYSEQVRKSKLKRKGLDMSKILSELVLKDCIVKSKSGFEYSKIYIKILEVDEEWIKGSYIKGKKQGKNTILKIDNIMDIELL